MVKIEGRGVFGVRTLDRPDMRSLTLSAARGLRGRRRRTAYEAVAAAVELPAVGQVGAARQDQQRAVLQPCALQQLRLCKAFHLRGSG